jgi:molybdenum cofactor cytidylyltransferase
MRVAAVVLAAGAGSRFGGGKLLAALDGRPIVGHVVDAARAAGLQPIVVVVPPTGELDELDLGTVRRVTNETPQEGLSSSVRVGLRELELDDEVSAAVILLGDQPLVRPEVIQALLAAADQSPTTPFVVPRYAADGAPNPILARRSIWRLADELAGDRGFGPVLASHQELVRFVAVSGSNPDIDTRADLAAVVEGGWRARVRAKDQVDR